MEYPSSSSKEAQLRLQFTQKYQHQKRNLALASPFILAMQAFAQTENNFCRFPREAECVVRESRHRSQKFQDFKHVADKTKFAAGGMALSMFGFFWEGVAWLNMPTKRRLTMHFEPEPKATDRHVRVAAASPHLRYVASQRPIPKIFRLPRA